jgi:flavorubredoxin
MGIASADNKIKTQIYDANGIDSTTLVNLMNTSTAFCIGSPTLNKNVVPPISHLLMELDTINVKDRLVLIFGSYG